MYDLVLAAAGGAVGGVVLTRAYHRLRAAPAHTPAQDALVCTCGQTFYAEQPAKEHAVTTHNAPPQAGEWRFLYEGAV